MEIFGGFMVMMSILSLFLAVVWLVMPFVVFAIKGKQDRTLEVLEAIEKRLALLEVNLRSVISEQSQSGLSAASDRSGEPSDGPPIQKKVIPTEPAEKSGQAVCHQ
ncbi:MAG: hypothetical protein WCI45_11220 [Desulfuromonadales bacterium]